MLYALIVLFVIQLVTIYGLYKLHKKNLNTETDLMISNTKLEQLYRKYEVLKSDLKNVIERIKWIYLRIS